MSYSKTYSFQKTYDLEAQTPLIHFQYDQSGSTLRATEVKPKLDRFLYQCVGGNVDKSWLIKEGDMALNYKLRLEANGKREIVELGIGTDFDIYYGNMGDDTIKKRGVKQNVKITVTCMIRELLTLIDDNIASFFVATNFGTMQNKGFGSYIISGKPCNPNYIGNTLKNVYGSSACYMVPAGGAAFKRIKTIYSLMKSGINFRRYQRSLLFLYMHKRKNLGNEKAWLKNSGIAPIVFKPENKKRGEHLNKFENYYYVRALLGVSERLEFKDSTDPRSSKTQIKIKNTDKEIERLNSPIFFKVIKGNIYFVARRIDDEIYDAKFEFSSPKGNGIIKVPTKKELGQNFIDDFLAYSVDELNKILSKFDEERNNTIMIREVKG